MSAPSETGDRRGTRRFPPEATALAFPLGGVGTGNVSLGARGDLRHWEIFNAPARDQSIPNSFWVLRAQEHGKHPVARVLEGPIRGTHARSHGYHPTTGAGLPRFSESVFTGEYPLAWLDLRDAAVPVAARLEAFTPLIPLDAADSGIPGALLTYHLTNVTTADVDVTIAASLMNPVGGIAYGPFGNPLSAAGGRNVNEFLDAGAFRGIRFRSAALAADDLRFGDVSIVTEERDVTAKPVWLRAGWYDYLRDFWDDLTVDGRLSPGADAGPSPEGLTDTGSIAVHLTLAPRATREVRFYLTWYFPNRRRSWGGANARDDAPLVRNFYATRHTDSWDVARYLVTGRERLESGTRAFHAAMYEGTLPGAVVDAVTSNIVPARSTTCFWLDDGSFYGYEGTFDRAGSCAGTCTHVWSYAYTVASLFPELERRMRAIELSAEISPDGYVPFRTLGSFGEERVWLDYEAGRRHPGSRPPAAIDGQLGSVLRAYREWLMSGDREWLATIWPGVRSALSYVMDGWDADRDGVLDGPQHTTYDIDLIGPNPLCTTYYLAAVRAATKLALAMDDAAVAEQCATLAASGSARADALMWNGAYYQQVLDDPDARPYQHGAGCLSDQLLGQLHAHLLGLGHVLPEEHVRAALSSIVHYNFRPDLRSHVNCQRTFALNDESGLVMCSWPRGGRPRQPFIYSDEVWTGTEHQVAAHLACEGLVDEALTLVEGIRARHDGFRRDPYDEVECGHHYARSMASFAMLLALTGFRCDMGQGTMRFAPTVARGATTFRAAWFTGRGWGTYEQTLGSDGRWTPSVTVVGGDMTGVEVTACGRTWTL